METGTLSTYLYTILNDLKYFQMYVISDKAITSIKGNNRLMAKLMIAFDRGQNTIENWMNSKDVRLTTPIAIQLIGEESDLSKDEIILEETEVKEIVK